MNRQKKKTLLIALAAAVLCIAAIIFFIIRTNEYYLELDVPEETITIEYGADKLPEITGLCKGTLLNRKGKPVELTVTGECDFTKTGSYPLTFEAEYKGHPLVAEKTVVIQDTKPPVIELVSDPEHFTSPIAKYEEEGFSAIDNYDGDLTEKVVSIEENGVVTYTVTDSSGNVTTAKRTIVYKDVVPPVIKLKGESSMGILLGKEFKDPGFTATDDCDGDITAKVTVTGSVDTKKEGNYKITYTVTDSYNNKDTKTRNVRVYKKQTSSSSSAAGSKIVYLTFDDGPGPYTQKLLNTLDKYGVKATFFVTNQFGDKYQSLIGEAHRRGHTIALHTYSHDYATVYKSESAYYKDLNKMKDVCIKQTGVAPSIVRFPGGTSNTISRRYCNGIMTTLSNSLPANGYYYSDWNVDSNDAGGATTSSQVASNVIAGIKRASVANVLMHDIKSYTVNAIDDIVSWGLANGYTFKAMTPGCWMPTFRPNN